MRRLGGGLAELYRCQSINISMEAIMLRFLLTAIVTLRELRVPKRDGVILLQTPFAEEGGAKLSQD
jgi:hypothetical protein